MLSDVLNVSFFIAAQCGTASLAWGGTGVAKSAFIEALAAKLGMKFFCFIPSQHMPEDISGIPFHDVSRKVAEMIPMEWIQALTEPGWLLLIDELTTAPQAMRPPLLSALNERRVGKLRFHPSTIILAAANPPELAPNSSPLEPSMLNRLYHHNWQEPFDTWLAGMLDGGEFQVPDTIPVVGDYSMYLPKWTRLVGSLCKAQPAIRTTTKIPDNEMAFPSLRQWYRLAHCLAGADKVGADGAVLAELGTGMVGAAATAQLMTYVASLDLHDPDAVLDGKEQVQYGEERVDQLVYLPVAIINSLRGNSSGKRLDKACEVLIDMGEHDLLDVVMAPLAEITELFPDYRIPKSLLSRYGNLIKQIGA
jgi:MoxR-like ATPase